jgi:hypothetical protein
MSWISTGKFLILAFFCFAQLALAEDFRLDANARSAVRQWSDISGRFQTDATLLDCNLSTVRLRKTTGSIISVPLDRLCPDDRKFIAAAKRAEVAPAATHDTYKPIVSEAIAAARAVSLSAELAPKIPENMVYVRLSKPFLQRIVSRAVSTRHNVIDNILGSPVSGVCDTNGTTEVALTPNSEYGELEIHFSGTTSYQTVADAGVIQVHVRGGTEFASAKAVRFDGHGIELGPAATNARTSSSIVGIESSLPGLRGRIARRIGSARAAECEPEAREITTEHTIRRINASFDRTTSRDIAGLWQRICDQIAKLPADDPLRPHGWQASTTADALQIVFLGHKGGVRVPPPPEPSGRPDVVVQINSAVFSRALVDPDFHKLLQPFTAHLTAMSAASPTHGPSMQWSPDHDWLALSWDSSTAPSAAPAHAATLAGENGETNH